MTAPIELEQRVGYTIKRVYHAGRVALDHALHDLGLTMPQWAVLNVLGRQAGLCNAELARCHFVTPQTMNAIVFHLEQAGLVERRPQPGNGTVLETYLTDAGRERLAAGNRRADAVEARMLAPLNDEEKQTLHELLLRCADSLGGTGDDCIEVA
jgi:DNA-binding MarR family transcriptional regulator